MIPILRRCVARNIWVTTLKVKVTAWPCSIMVSGPQLRFLKSDFITISQKWSPYWDDVSRATFGSLPWRSRSQHDIAAKSCPAHNFIIWSRISKLFHRNDHFFEMTKFLACVQNLLGEHHPVRLALVFSSPEHKVLRVSYCDWPLSVVRRCASSVVHRASCVNFYIFFSATTHWI